MYRERERARERERDSIMIVITPVDGALPVLPPRGLQGAEAAVGHRAHLLLLLSLLLSLLAVEVVVIVVVVVVVVVAAVAVAVAVAVADVAFASGSEMLSLAWPTRGTRVGRKGRISTELGTSLHMLSAMTSASRLVLSSRSFSPREIRGITMASACVSGLVFQC